MGDDDLFIGAQKVHGMLSHHISAPQGMDADLVLGPPLVGLMAAEDKLALSAPSGFDLLRKHQGRAAGRVHFFIVMDLHDLRIESVAKDLGDAFDPEIVEIHHNKKVDAPSGTALMLAEQIESARSGESELVFGRHETNKRRTKDEIGIHSLRGGNMVGEHAVHFLGTDEEIIITHRATSKRVFAIGALRAATWIVDQPPGLYSMEDLIQA